MLSQLARLAALMASYGLLQMGHAALGALFVQQGPAYEFSDTFLGLLTSVSYVGFFAGVYLTRYLVSRVSYIRTFSVCAAAMTVLTLCVPLLPTAAAWIVLRLLHGVFFSTTIVICDGWLNTTTDNASRSRVLSVQMVVSYAAFGVSQYILVVGESLAGMAFSIVAMFIALSLAPICLTRFAEPQFVAPKKEDGMAPLSVRDIYRISPVSFLAHFCVGLTQGAAWLFVRYAESVSQTTQAVALLSLVFFISGGFFQLPVGWLSDRAKDRRTVMGGVYALSAALGALLFFGELFSFAILAVLIFLYGAVSVTGFSLNIAYGQDFVARERSTEYGGRLFQVYAAGALVGPLAAGALMDGLSLAWLFAFCAAAFAAAAVVALTPYIMPRYIPAQQEAHAILSPHTTLPEEAPEYSEVEIGPVLPEEHRADDDAAPDAPDAVGPDLPAAVDGEKETFVGPAAPGESEK